MPTLTRRHFLAATAGALSAAALGDGFLVEPTAIDVTHHDVPIPGLPPALDGVRIACLADVHLHDGVSRAARAALEHLDRERPEIVVLAGDICNHQRDLPTLTAWARDACGYVDELPKSIMPSPALFLAGHTHGGQIRLPGVTLVLPVGSGRFVAGWYRDTLAPLYVSRGIGTVFVPARLFCPPELPVFTLRSSLHQLTP